MKTKFTLLAIFISISVFSQAPSWAWATSGGGSTSNDYSYAVCSDQIGDSYVTGSFSSSTITFGNITLTNSGLGSDIFIVKYDPSGNVIWAKKAGGYYSGDCGTGIAADAYGNCYVTGYFTSYLITFGNITLTNACSSGCNGFFVVKYTAAGNVVWAKTTSNGMVAGTGIAVDQNNNVYVTGYFVSMNATFGSTTVTYAGGGNQDGDIFVVKYDPNGNVLWAKSAGGGNYDDRGNSIAVDAAGNSYVTGYFRSASISFGSFTISNPSTGQEIFVAKYDPNGNIQWVDSSGTLSYGISTGICTDANGNSYITGYFYGGSPIFGSDTLTHTGMFTVKHNSSGNVLWAKDEATGSCSGSGICIDALGCAYVTGYFLNSSLNFGNTTISGSSQYGNVLVAKYDSSGNEVWAQNAVGTDYGKGYGITISPGGKVVVTGSFYGASVSFGSNSIMNADTSTNPSTSRSDVFIAKLDNILGVNEINSSLSVVVFPNPSSGIFTIESSEPISEIEITNILGELIYASTTDNRQQTMELDLSSQPNGIYFVNVKTGKGSFTQKVVISR